MRFHLTIIAIALSIVAALALPELLNPPLPPPVPKAPAKPLNPARPFTPPVTTVDKLRVRDLIDRHDFAALDALFRDLQERFLRDVKDETDLWVALETFDTAAPEVGEALAAWIAAAPQSAFARLARAQYRLRAAADRRGMRFAKDTPKQQLEEMSTILAESVADARAALERNARLAAAYGPLINAAQMKDGLDKCGEVSRAALALAPASYRLRTASMACLVPRWGGSYEMMDEFARRSQQWQQQNPRLDALRGFSSWDQGRILLEAKRYDDAIRAFNDAIASGDDWRFYRDRARALSRLGRSEAALRDYERALALWPQANDLRVSRVATLAALKREDAASAAEIAAVERLDPTNRELDAYRAHPAQVVAWEGGKLLEAGRIDEAIATFTRAHEMAPGKSDALSDRSAAWVKKRDYERALKDLEEDVALDAHRFISYQRIDWILAQRKEWDRIIAYWNRYVAVEPGDPRGYIERGGAYLQKGDRPRALFDAQKACDLGDAKGCELVKRHQG